MYCGGDELSPSGLAVYCTATGRGLGCTYRGYPGIEDIDEDDVGKVIAAFIGDRPAAELEE